MTTVTDDEFQKQVATDPIKRALNDFLTASGTDSMVLFAVSEDHKILVMTFENGTICSYMEPALEIAQRTMLQIAEMAGGHHDPDQSLRTQSMSHETADQRKH
jgi:hypothetical protein